MRILVIGAGGLLGKDLLEEWKDDDVVPAASTDADIRDLSQVRRLVSAVRPEWIILAAAFTDVDGSEQRPDVAFAVNRDGTRNVATVAREYGSKLFYVSTDYVFDGALDRPYEPSDSVRPLNIYGASKAAGEREVQESSGEWIIARTSWLFGTARACFPENILRAAESGKELAVVTDQTGSPTYTKDLARAIRELVHCDARGILHIANSGFCSRFELAVEVLRQSGLSYNVRPIVSGQTDRRARRPAYSALSTLELARYGIQIRSWQDALHTYLDDLQHEGPIRG
jgi:dTDP-4-dehydrorhamnose reductase